MKRSLCFSTLVLALGISVVPINAAEPFRFPEGKHGKGELRYRNGIPVLEVEGTSAEIGEQIAMLVGKPCVRLLNYPKEALAHISTPAAAQLVWPILTKKCNQLLDNFPDDYRLEFETMVKTSGLDREALVVGNTVFDLKAEISALFGCSALMVEPQRSKTGQLIFGRNMDYLSLGYLHEYTLVTIYRPKGKHGFATVGYPGTVGCLSGINDAGLTVAILESTGSNPAEGPAFNPSGIPYALCYRRLLEECATVGEARAMLQTMKRTTTNNLALCDRSSSAVLEVTPTRVMLRPSQNGIGVCTNHFCTKELKLSKPKNFHTTLDRFAILEKAQAMDNKLGVTEVHQYLDEVHQGKNTLQTMIFEPQTLTLHLAWAVGEIPSSSQHLKRLELAPFFANTELKR